MHKTAIFAVALAAPVVFGIAPFVSRAASAEPLISEAEAGLPAAADAGMTLRGITRGPAIEVVSPSGDKAVKSPMALVVKFNARNNAAIDKDSVKVTYIKAQSVDLTSRVKSFIKDEGIDMKAAEVPPGQHLLRVDVKDSQGRAATSIFKVTVEK